MVMPFLMYDSDPYMVVSDDGQLFWIYDAYTVSSKFPYSQPMGNGINYIRNSVKVTINAYDGSMKFYMADKEDPIVRTIGKIFPGTLLPLSEMPADLKKHIRYPLDIFGIQTIGLFNVSHGSTADVLQQGRPVGDTGHGNNRQDQRSWNPITRS